MSLHLILMGAQGAGKGLQAKRIEAALWHPASLDRRPLPSHANAHGQPRALKVQELMAAGILIDDDTTNAIVADRLSQPDAANWRYP